jgi:hypothetical protein
MTRRRSPASLLIDANKSRVPPEDAQARLEERDRRQAADTRTPAQVWLNEPPPGRSALAQERSQAATVLRSASGTRVDLWRK